MLCPCERLEQQQGKMQSDKMCPVTLGSHKTKTPIGRHPWQPPTPAGFEQGVPWRSPCEHSNSSRIRAHATQNAVRQNAFRYLRSRLQHQQASKLWISSRILCNNFLGALPLTPKEGSADFWVSCTSHPFYKHFWLLKELDSQQPNLYKMGVLSKHHVFFLGFMYQPPIL